MNLEMASQIINEGCRVIGLKDIDMKRLEEAMNAKESSFALDVSEVIEPTVEAVIESVPEMNPEPVVTETPVLEEVPVQSNIFDQEVPVVNNPVPQFEAPVQSSQQDVFFDNSENLNIVTDEVQGGQQETIESNLDTPQTFFEKMDTSVESNYVESDSAIFILDNLRKVIEDKNSMIRALNDKVSILENQLRVSEESRKVFEAQRDAAQTTLEQARQAEIGPTLTYQQNNNYNQAA